MGKLTGKTAVVTGASSGIGEAIARHLAREGANVVLTARRKEKLENISAQINERGEGRALAVAADVSNRQDVVAMTKRANDAFGMVDIYVNNAGAMLSAAVREGKTEEWDEMIDVNIKGVLYGIHAVLSQMLDRSSGHIVNISSVSGQEVTKVSTVYSATKYAVRAISMGLEKELARTGVRVTNISPGMVDARDEFEKQGETEEQQHRRFGNRKPLKTDDIARAIVYAVTQPDDVNVNEVTVRPV